MEAEVFTEIRNVVPSRLGELRYYHWSENCPLSCTCAVVRRCCFRDRSCTDLLVMFEHSFKGRSTTVILCDFHNDGWMLGSPVVE